MSTEKENTQLEETVILEAKVQTIYFEDTQGNLDKHHHVSNTRINAKQALEILQAEGVQVNLVLRTVTERIGIELTRAFLQANITTSERFYQSQQK